jgi:uncharacterized protein YebE (UPF0316 family)
MIFCMALEAILNSPWYTWAVLPALIFIARICDVSLGTIRVIFISKGYRFWAPILGFFEVLIWLMAVRQVLTTMQGPIAFIAYAAGFAAGTFAGIIIEEKISLGTVLFRVITGRDATKLLNHLREYGYQVTAADAKSSSGKVHILYTILRRKELPIVIKTVKEFHPKAFYVVEDVRFASENGKRTHVKKRKSITGFGMYRKGK